jgi:hypothetical protein
LRHGRCRRRRRSTQGPRRVGGPKRIIIDHYPEITWQHSHVVITDDGAVKTFCLYDAPSEQIVRRHAEELGLHDVEGLYEDITPADFPLD